MKFKSESIVAFAAIFVSTATLVVYMYQAHIMQKQQMTSVWPYLQWGFTNTPNGVYIQLENKGIGPAIVNSVSLKMNEQSFINFQKVFEALGDTVAHDYSYSSIGERVIAPGEIIQPFFIGDWRKGEELLKKIRQQSFEFTICYCSVYGDCWTTYGRKVVEGECSEQKSSR